MRKLLLVLPLLLVLLLPVSYSQEQENENVTNDVINSKSEDTKIKDDTHITIVTTKKAHESKGDKKKITKEEILNRFPLEKHHEFMHRAIANSAKAGVEYETGGAFGAVIVDKNGTVLSDGVNHVIGQHDPTWHGEMDAIRKACALLKKHKLTGCILYTSTKPCPMCLATAYWADIDGIIYGAEVADSKKYGNYDDSFIYEEFKKPAEERTITEQSMLRQQAVEV